MKKYDNYKDSGNEWIGEIPSHWEVKRLKNIGNLFSGLSGKSGSDFSPEATHSTKPFINFTNVANNKYIVPDNFGYVNLEEDEKQNLVKKGDLLFLMSSENQEELGKSSLLNDDFGELYLNSFCKGLRISSLEIYPNFLNYLLNSSILSKLVSLEGRGFTRINLRMEGVQNLPVFYPSITEQTVIASYLDHITTQVDELISKKKQFITLLQEERTAVINQVVTKGLNPKVKMKDSGIEWLGEIPENWEITKIKYQFNVQGGGTPSKDNLSYWNGNIPWVSPKDMKQKEIIDTIDKTNLLGIFNSSSKIVESESLLMVVRSGILQRTIPIGINKIPVSLNQDIKSFTSKGSHSIHLLYYFIKGWETHLLEDWSKEGATVESIEMGYLLNFSLPMPPSYEQRDIVEFIENEEKNILHAMKSLQKEIELLKEYKTVLISEVVTGKIDVTDVVLN